MTYFTVKHHWTGKHQSWGTDQGTRWYIPNTPLEKGFSSSLVQQVCIWFVQMKINSQHISDLGDYKCHWLAALWRSWYNYKILGSSFYSKFSCFLTQPCAYHSPNGKPEFPSETLLIWLCRARFRELNWNISWFTLIGDNKWLNCLDYKCSQGKPSATI